MPDPIITPFDEPWKEALHRFFPQFLALLVPALHAEPDWSRGFDFLDHELQAIAREAEFGQMRADTLVRARSHGDAETWILIHVEVQSQVDRSLPLRMFRYHLRIFDRYAVPVIGIAVLGDDRRTWRPESYGYAFVGALIRLRFISIKLLDWEARWRKLVASTNVFAAFVMAHLKALRTEPDVRRLHWKWTLIRGLFERGLDRNEVLELCRLIDWMLALPPPLEARFRDEVRRHQEGSKMPFMTWWEQKGLEKGLRQGGVQFLRARFGEVPGDVIESLARVEESAALESLARSAASVQDVEAFRALVRAAIEGEHGRRLNGD